MVELWGLARSCWWMCRGKLRGTMARETRLHSAVLQVVLAPPAPCQRQRLGYWLPWRPTAVEYTTAEEPAHLLGGRPWRGRRSARLGQGVAPGAATSKAGPTVRNPRLGDTLHREAELEALAVPELTDPFADAKPQDSSSDFGGPTSKISYFWRDWLQRDTVAAPPTVEEASKVVWHFSNRSKTHRLLNCMAAFAGEGWETGARTQNLQLGGYDAARLMIFCEQAALDSGRLQLAWLLAGYSEPTSSTSSAARRSTLKSRFGPSVLDRRQRGLSTRSRLHRDTHVMLEQASGSRQDREGRHRRRGMEEEASEGRPLLQAGVREHVECDADSGSGVRNANFPEKQGFGLPLLGTIVKLY